MRSYDHIFKRVEIRASSRRLLQTDYCGQAALELLDDFFVGGVYFDVGQGALGVAIGEGVGHALLAFGHVLAAEDVE